MALRRYIAVAVHLAAALFAHADPLPTITHLPQTARDDYLRFTTSNPATEVKR
jgi:hypothetical protein